ncbi:MAG: PHP domain-containing protein [Candidatus Hydrogenedentes bacterium]|nr:PHP domain-containing protein [Candidatus Hydrogenedentota bacterium]
MAFVDLHLHTHFSDGLDAPAAVAARAAKLGCAAIAITDHDTVAGVGEAAAACKEAGLEFLTGVEISAEYEGEEVHIVGLGIDVTSASLLAALDWLRAARASRATKIIERLVQIGAIRDAAVVVPHLGKNVVGRLHIARALHALGITRSAQEAFNRFLNPGLPAYVPRELLGAAKAIDLIHEARGLAFIAHPGLTQITRRLLPKLTALPFDGIEAYHISHSPARTREYHALAKSKHWLAAGGSDCHGGAKGAIEMGKVRVPCVCFERIRAVLAGQNQDSGA